MKPELLSEVAHLLCSKLNIPNPNVDLEKMLSVLLTFPAPLGNASIMKKKDLMLRESLCAFSARTLHPFLLLNQTPHPLLYPLPVTLLTPVLPT